MSSSSTPNLTTLDLAGRLGRIVIRLDTSPPVPPGTVNVYVQASMPVPDVVGAEGEPVSSLPIVISSEQHVPGNTPLEFLRLQLTRNLGVVLCHVIEEVLNGKG